MDFEPTVEELIEISEELNQDIKNIGDVSDIQQPLPNLEQFEQLKKLLDTLPREQSVNLLANLIGNNNKMNPNNNSFSGVSEDEIRRHKFRQRLEQKKHARLSKVGQKAAQQKHIKSLEPKDKPEDK